MKHNRMIALPAVRKLFCVLAALLFALPPTPAQAAVSTPAAGAAVSGAQTTDTPQGTADTYVAPAQLPPEEAAQSVRPPLPDAAHTADFTWSSIQTLHGIASTTSLFFNVPAYWDTQYAYMELAYTVSQLIDREPSTLTFSINGKPFYSTAVRYDTSEQQTLFLSIPTELLVTGYNSLTISGYVRLFDFDEDGCADDLTDANWINFFEGSYLRVGYDIGNRTNSLSLYPYPFLSTLNPNGAQTAIAVSDAVDNAELAAAMLLVADLGDGVASKNDLSVGRWSDVAGNGEKHTIFVGLTRNAPAEIRPLLTAYGDRLKEQALLLLTKNEQGNTLLLLVSENPDCLLEGARLLMDEERTMQELGTTALVRKGTAEQVQLARQTSSLQAGQYTLEAITNGGLSFTGPFHQTQEVFLPVSSDHTIAPDSKISLQFRYSENLDFTRSMFTVYCGNVPVASKKLSKERASGDELTFYLPSDLVGTSVRSMVFAFDLEIQDLYCTPRQTQMPWAYISKDSELFLPSGTPSLLQLESRPYPFQKNGMLYSTLLVISDTPSAEELSLLGRAMAVYGNGTGPYGTLRVCRASEAEAILGEQAAYNILTAGLPGENRFLAGLNNTLYFRYAPDWSRFESNERLILSDAYAGSIGTVQLMPSPYAESYGLLVLTGPDAEALRSLDRLLREEELRWNLKNDCVLVGRDLNVTSFRFQKEIEQQEKPSFAKTVVENRESLLFALLGTSVMLLLFLAMLLIYIRIRLRNKKNG